MASNDAYKSGNIAPEVLDYLEQYEALQQRINAERQRQRQGDTKALSTSTKRAASLDSLKITRAEIDHLDAEKDRIWKHLRQLDPVLAGQLEVRPPDFDTLRQLIDRPTTALLSFYSTNDHTYIFVLRQDRIDLHTCTDQGYGQLQTWILRNWLTPYQQNFSTWREAMPQRLAELSQRLQLDTLIQTHLQGIDELILIPHIALHLIPFAALPVEEGVRVLGDAFKLRLVPSAQVLNYCQQRPPPPSSTPSP